MAEALGAKLKRAREASGVALRDIALSTKISVTALEALERNDFSRLPGGIFSRAFIRSYAAAVGLDPEATVHEFLAEVTRSEDEAAQDATTQSAVTPEDRAFVERQKQAIRLLQIAAVLVVIAAGTADLPIAEEAAITAEYMENEIERVYDVGVAGIHRLFAHHETLVRASVLIVVAGMEGALPSVVGGLVDRPVIAVPTSVGYGASFGGLAALLGMLNSCAAGVTVVNIDNGFGAGVAAGLMNRA